MITAKLQQGKNCKISDTAFIGYKEHGGEIILGNHVTINDNCMIRTCTGIIRIGNNSSIGYSCIFHGKGNITIGNYVLISPFVQIYAQNHGIAKNKIISLQEQTSFGIVIEDDVWIGAGSIIVDNIRISKGSVIGAGSILTTNTNNYEIWAGNPAKKIGERK